MKVYVLVLINFFIFTGCSTGPMNTSSISGSTYSEDKTFGSKKKYTVQVESVSIQNISEKLCPSQDQIEKTEALKKLMSYANGCANKKNWDMVDQVAARMNVVEPDAPWGAYYMSLSAEVRGHLDRAYWMIELANKKSDRLGIILYQKGRVLWSMEYYKESLIEIKKSLELDRNIKDAYVFLGQAYLKQLNFNDSIRNFQEALKHDSNNKESLLGLVSCYIELDKEKEAMEYVMNGITVYNRSIDFRIHEAFIYENLRNQKDIALIKYRSIKELYAAKKIEGVYPQELDLKIQELEKALLKVPAKLAGK